MSSDFCFVFENSVYRFYESQRQIKYKFGIFALLWEYATMIQDIHMHCVHAHEHQTLELAGMARGLLRNARLMSNYNKTKYCCIQSHAQAILNERLSLISLNMFYFDSMCCTVERHKIRNKKKMFCFFSL